MRALRRLLCLLLAATAALAGAEPVREAVRLQLDWYHQFQFAGAYAAESQGYFRDEALEVEIVEATPGLAPVDDLFADRCQFTFYGSRILRDWAEGRDLCLVATVFQRNPFGLWVRAESPWTRLADLASAPRERRVHTASDSGVEVEAALREMRTTPSDFFFRRKLPGDIDLFAAGELDVLPAFACNEVIALAAKGIQTRRLELMPNPERYFGSILVCTGEQWRTRPDLVNRFRRAFVRGWDWALRNRQAAVDLAFTQRSSRIQPVDRAHLAAQAESIARLIDPEVIQFGDVRIDRLEAVAAEMQRVGIPARVDHALVWKPPTVNASWLRLLAWGLGMAGIVCVILAIAVLINHRRLRRSDDIQRTLMDLAEGLFLFHAVPAGPGLLRITSASPSLNAILGRPLSVYRSDPEALPAQILEDDRRRLVSAVARTIAHRVPLRERVRLDHPAHQRPRILLFSACLLPGEAEPQLEGICIDLTAEAEAEDALLATQRRLQTAQKNESLGLLAGGVAHDFNNLLGAIRANSELALTGLAEQDPARVRLQRVLDASDRAAGLVRQILAYTGRGTIEVRSIDIAEECRVLRDLLKHALPPGITIDVQAEPGLPAVMFDPAQLQQVLMNLIINAGESYQGRPGRVEVRLRARESGLIEVEVIDQGCGMDAATQARMFEPYFTTKRSGHGLGLAAVQGIITASGASISFTSAPGAGTTFSIVLPTSPPAGQAAPRSETPRPVPGRLVLVVDDDELMRDAAAQLVRGLGYIVETADGGLEASRILAERSREFSAAVIDCSMPDREGGEVVRELRQGGSTLPVVLVSGMTDSAKLGAGILDRRTRFLAKPFSQAMLDRSLRIAMRSTDEDESSNHSTFAAMQRESSLQRAIQPPKP